MRRRQLVEAVRSGQSLRGAATQLGFSVASAAYWVERARGKRIDRVDFANRSPGRAWNRTGIDVEQRILSLRDALREQSVLGEYGLDAIGSALQRDGGAVPSRTTIYRVLERHGAFDATHRQRRPAPASAAQKAGICPTWPADAPNSTASISSRT